MKRVFVFANGSFDEPDGFRGMLKGAEMIISADGGVRHLLKMGFVPNLIVGDFDSIEAEQLRTLESQGVIVERHLPDKDETDLELALRVAIKHRPDEIIACGLLGKRLDHMLANIFLCARPEWSCLVHLVDGETFAKVIRGGESLSIRGRPGGVVSLIPLSVKANVSLKGVRWPLENEDIFFGSSRTVSNELCSDEVTLRVREGVVLLVQVGVRPVVVG